MQPDRRWVGIILLFVGLAACEGERHFMAPVDTPAFGAAPGSQAAQPDTSVLARFIGLAGPGRGAAIAGAMIGPAGGSVRLGDFEIVVPPGAVDRNTRFSIRLPSAAAQRRHAWAEFSPHNRVFDVPVLLRLPHASTDAEPDAPAVWWAETHWVILPTAILPDGRIETPVLHFSVYGTWRSGITLAGG